MDALSPIDVEMYERRFKQLSEMLLKAHDLLIPDAYDMERESLLKAKTIIDGNFTGFNEVLNACSAGVIFNESYIPVEVSMGKSVSEILWECFDIISSVVLLKDDFNSFLESLSVMNPMVWKLDQFMEAEKKFSVIMSGLDECQDIIISVLGSLDGNTI